MKKEKDIYMAARNCRTGLYGVKQNGAWVIKPIYEAIEGEMWYENEYDVAERVWVKKAGRYGYLDITAQQELIPCEYGFPLYFHHGYAEAWLGYKAGIINLKNEVVVPMIYDAVRWRWNENNDVCQGVICTTNDGKLQAYDENMMPDMLTTQTLEEEKDERVWHEAENATRSIEEIEDRVREEFVKWRSLTGSEAKEQKTKVEGLLYDRRYRMNAEWVHCKENAERIQRVNTLLNKTVEKAVKLGRQTATSLEWMNKVPNRTTYEVEVFVCPHWTNSKSEWGYKPTLSRTEEQDKLIEEEDGCDLHIWNIIAAMNECYSIDGMGACFYHWANSGAAREWNLKELVMDDGQSWDEAIHYPAYMDCCFLHPFHLLYCDLFIYSLEDIARMNDFVVRVNVKLETHEQQK